MDYEFLLWVTGFFVWYGFLLLEQKYE
jgi:hypothetical protein